jgi:hypothetical protein
MLGTNLVAVFGTAAVLLLVVAVMFTVNENYVWDPCCLKILNFSHGSFGERLL